MISKKESGATVQVQRHKASMLYRIWFDTAISFHMELCALHIWRDQTLPDSDLQSFLANKLAGIHTSQLNRVVSFCVSRLFRPSFRCAELAPVVLEANTGSMTCPTTHATFPWCKEITYQTHVAMLHVPSSCGDEYTSWIDQTESNQRVWDAQTRQAWLRHCAAWPRFVRPLRRKIAVKGEHA